MVRWHVEDASASSNRDDVSKGNLFVRKRCALLLHRERDDWAEKSSPVEYHYSEKSSSRCDDGAEISSSAWDVLSENSSTDDDTGSEKKSIHCDACSDGRTDVDDARSKDSTCADVRNVEACHKSSGTYGCACEGACRQ